MSNNVTNGLQHDFILLDRSGSMQGLLWTEALNSVNSYVKKLAEEKVDTGVTLAVFDTGHDGRVDFQVVRDRIIPSTWKPVTDADATPRNGTPLNDATARLIALAEGGNYEKVVLVIMTDGYENASKEYTVKQIKDRLDACRAKQWVVIFLGASFDNAAQATNLGSSESFFAEASVGNMNTSMGLLASKRGAYGATGNTSMMAYSADEKALLKEEVPIRKNVRIDVTV